MDPKEAKCLLGQVCSIFKATQICVDPFSAITQSPVRRLSGCLSVLEYGRKNARKTTSGVPPDDF